MSSLMREVVEMGWKPLLEDALRCLPIARFDHGTNDVVIVGTVEADGAYALKANTRERVLELMIENLPMATETIEKLRQPLPPDRFHLVVFHLKTPVDVYDFDIPLKGTTGVLN